MQLSVDERRALAVILGLLLLAALARWVERPRAVPLLADAPPLDVAALEEESRALRAPAGSAAAAAGPVDLNTASARELQRLPGVGAAVAARIVDERTGGGPFSSLAEVAARVRGVGPAMLGKWEGKVVPLPEHGSPAVRAEPARPATAPSTERVQDAASSPEITAIDLNRATSSDLEKISGVGPILAGRLLARRDSLGGFSDWADVDAVTGVGPAMLARLKGLAVLGQGPPSRAGAPAH